MDYITFDIFHLQTKNVDIAITTSSCVLFQMVDSSQYHEINQQIIDMWMG